MVNRVKGRSVHRLPALKRKGLVDFGGSPGLRASADGRQHRPWARFECRKRRVTATPDPAVTQALRAMDDTGPSARGT